MTDALRNESETDELLRELAAGCAAAGGTAPAGDAALARALGQAVEAGRAAWPRIPYSGPAFAFQIGRLLEASSRATAEAAASAIAALNAADLYLASASARGLPEALNEIEARYIRSVPLTLDGGATPVDDPDSARALLRDKLLVAKDGAPPRIATYAGRGPLAAWIAIAAQRTLLSLKRKEGAQQRAHDRALREAIVSDSNPELRYMKAQYRDGVAAAIRDAIAELPDRDRALLKLGLVGKLSLDAIGASYNVNASTVSRWLGRVRESILERTLALLRERFQMTAPEAASITRLVASQIELSVARLL